MQNLLRDLQDLLAQDPRLISQDGTLLKNLVIELGLKLDPDLLRRLLSHDRIREHFFRITVDFPTRDFNVGGLPFYNTEVRKPMFEVAFRRVLL